MFIGTDLASAVFWNLVRLIVILPPWGWEVMGLVLIRSGAVRMDTCCCRPPAMLPLLVGAIEYSVSGCSCVISFFFRCPCTSTLCWLYKICTAWFKKNTQHSKITNIYGKALKIHQTLFSAACWQGGCLRLPSPKLEQWCVLTLWHQRLCLIIRVKIDLMSFIWQLYYTNYNKEN